MTYFEDIKRIRKESKMSQSTVSGAAKITRTYLSKVEGGHDGVSVSVLSRIASALGKKLLILFIDEEKES